jgi:hypothetical protein
VVPAAGCHITKGAGNRFTIVSALFVSKILLVKRFCRRIYYVRGDMKLLQSAFASLIVLLTATVAFSQQIPAGTVLPVMTNTTVDAGKAKPGDKLSARLMQDVVLPSGEKIRRGAKLEGQVVQASSSNSTSATLAVRFDRLISDGKQFPLTVRLRALASMMDVFDAQLPVGTFDDYGPSIDDWTTVQVGGAAVYLGDGTVRDGMQVIGRAPGYGIVTAKLVPAPKLGCKAIPAESQSDQSLWVFSPWACGTYGFEDLTIAHHGVTSPVGTIELTASARFRVKAGSGWLLCVVAAEAPANPMAGN